MLVRVVYGIVLFLAVAVYILRRTRWMSRHEETDADKPTSWRGITQLNQEERARAIQEFLSDCGSALDVEDVFAVAKNEDVRHSSSDDYLVKHTSGNSSVKRL